MSSEVKVGVLVVSAIAIFTATFLSVATVQLRGKKLPYRAYFDFAGGLERGKLVRFGGLKAGVITNVRPSAEDPTRAEVIFELREDVPVNRESVATISSLNALGDNYLEITPGSKDAPRIEPGGVVQSRETVGFGDIAAQVSDVVGTANTVLIELKGDVTLLVKDLRDLAHNLQELTGEENQENVAKLLRNANQMFEDQAPKFDAITDRVAELLTKVDLTLDDVRKVAHSADETVANVNRTVDETREPIKRDLAELENTLTQARQMLEEVETLMLMNSEGIADTVENFRSTSENLEQFSDEIRQRPWSLLRSRPKPDRQVPVGAP